MVAVDSAALPPLDVDAGQCIRDINTTLHGNRHRLKGRFVAVPDTVDLPGGIAGAKQATFLQVLSIHTGLTSERRRGHYINFHSEFLRQLLGGKYRLVIQSLRDARVIEVNDRYCSGNENNKAFSKSYRLSRAHRHGRSKLHQVPYAGVVRRLSKAYEIDPDNLAAAGLHFHGLSPRFSIDIASASVDNRLRNHWDQCAIARLANGDEFAKRCKYGRYHSLFTQLPKLARRYVSADDDADLAIVDVAACQPLLLAFLATTTNTLLATGQSPNPSNGAHFLRRDAPADVQHWLDLCEAGELYAWLYKAIQGEPRRLSTLTLESGRVIRMTIQDLPPNAFKRASLIPIFDRVAAMVANPIFQVIRRNFPTIGSWLIENKKGSHQTVARLLQKAESFLMIDGVGNQLRQEFPNAPVQPIHDALFCRRAFADTAADVIREQFSLFGLNPRIKIAPTGVPHKEIK